jgi:hypothetical protein
VLEVEAAVQAALVVAAQALLVAATAAHLRQAQLLVQQTLAVAAAAQARP